MFKKKGQIKNLKMSWKIFLSPVSKKAVSLTSVKLKLTRCEIYLIKR